MCYKTFPYLLLISEYTMANNLTDMIFDDNYLDPRAWIDLQKF